MRIISLIAIFVLVTVVYADVITSNSGVAEVRRLRSEVNIFRIRRPVDGSISSDDESTSAQALAAASRNPSPPIRSRKRKDITEDVEYASGILVNLKHSGNGDDAASSTGMRPNRQKQKDQLNLNGNPEETADMPSPSRRKTFKKSTVQERQDIELYLRQRMKADGSLPYGTNTEAAKHFGRSQSTISQIYYELKPNVKERVISYQERQDIVSFLRQRLKADGSLPRGTINEAAEHFNRNRHTIQKISKELKPVSALKRLITGQERQDIMMFLSQRINAKGLLPTGTFHEAAENFGRHHNTIKRIYKELKPKYAYERVVRDQERQDIMIFLRQRMNFKGLLQYGAIHDAAQHFGRHQITISRIYKNMIPKSKNEHGAQIDEKTIVPT
jgi:DNA-binding transcriptional regulator YhcF (GntR family)